jgi:hypothetical protein
MGVCFAPAFAQYVSNYLCDLIKKRVGNVDCDILAWVDNFILLSNDPDVHRQLTAVFKEVCATVGLTMKEYEEDPDEHLDALGIHFDLKQHTASPTEETKRDLHDRLQLLRQDHTVTDFLKFTGTVMWVTFSITKTPLCTFPGLMNELRSVCSAQQWTAPHCVSETLLRELQTACDDCRIAERSILITSPAPSRVIWTDASTVGMAGYDEQSNEAWWRSLPAEYANSPHFMALFEMMAVMTSAEQFKLSQGSWTLATDNSAVERALIRGHSGSKSLDGMIRTLLANGQMPTHVSWVPSACQRTDALTRPQTRHLGVKTRCSHHHPAAERRWR